MAGAFLASLPIPVDALVAQLRWAAVPGFTGIVLVEFGIRPEAAELVRLQVLRKPTIKTHAPAKISIPVTGDPERDNLVRKVMKELQDKLCIRTGLTAIEAHFDDGRLLKYQPMEAPLI